MRFHITLLSLVAAAVAQSKGNAFDIPKSGNFLLTAGQPQTFTWSNPVGSTVTLVLRTGANSDLKDVSTIASSIQNTGTYTWSVPADTPEGANYAVEIINDSDKSQVNYTPQFVIQSDVKAVATSGGSTSLVTATTMAASMSSGASMTMSMTSAAATSSTTAAANSNSSASSTQASGSNSASASKTAGPSSAGSSGTAPAPSTGAAAQGYTASSGLLAVAVAFAVAL